MTVSDSPAQRQTPPQTPGGTAPRARTAAFFDLDKTIIAKSSTLAFSKPFFAQGLLNRRAVLKSSYAQFIFLLSGADHDQMDRMRTHLTNMCAGWDVAQVRSIVNETLHDIVTPLVFAEAADLIAAHKLCGRDVVVVSASGEEIVGPIARALGATHAMATRMIVEDGKYTGEVAYQRPSRRRGHLRATTPLRVSALATMRATQWPEEERGHEAGRRIAPERAGSKRLAHAIQSRFVTFAELGLAVLKV